MRIFLCFCQRKRPLISTHVLSAGWGLQLYHANAESALGCTHWHQRWRNKVKRTRPRVVVKKKSHRHSDLYNLWPCCLSAVWSVWPAIRTLTSSSLNRNTGWTTGTRELDTATGLSMHASTEAPTGVSGMHALIGSWLSTSRVDHLNG